MEKTIKLTRNELIKWVILFATVISAFIANQYQINNNTRRIDLLEKDLKEIRECQTRAAVEVATMNGKLDEINANVTTIKQAIINRGLGSAR